MLSSQPKADREIMNTELIMDDFEVVEKLPKYNDINEFIVEVSGQLRQVNRVGNNSAFYTLGILIFTDCNHQQQQAICDESKITAWKIVCERPESNILSGQSKLQQGIVRMPIKIWAREFSLPIRRGMNNCE
jgi:hypothetical protein